MSGKQNRARKRFRKLNGLNVDNMDISKLTPETIEALLKMEEPCKSKKYGCKVWEENTLGIKITPQLQRSPFVKMDYESWSGGKDYYFKLTQVGLEMIKKLKTLTPLETDKEIA